MLLKRILLLSGVFVYSWSLFSQTFEEKKWSFYIDIGGSKLIQKEKVSDEKGVQLYAMQNLVSASEEDRQYAVMALSQMNHSDPEVYDYSLGMERRIIPWFGLGISIEQTQIQVKNPPEIWSNYFILSQMNSTTTTEEKKFFNLMSIRREEKMLNFNTMNVDFILHYPALKFWDPYIGIKLGYGKVSESNVSKAGIFLGVRYWFHPSYMINFKIFRYNYNGEQKRGQTFSPQIQQAGAQLGFGIGF